MKVVKLEDVAKLHNIAQYVRDIGNKRSNEFIRYRYGITPHQIDILADRLKELAFEIDDPN